MRNFFRNIMAARQRRVNREIADHIRRIEYKKETTDYVWGIL